MARSITLSNGALSEPFSAFRNDKKLTVARGWAPWWVSAAEGDPDWKNRQPVFARYTLEGKAVQQMTTPFGTHIGGLWQQVPTATGNQYELSAQGQAWSSEDPAPGSQLEASDVNLQIGIDPTGGLDPGSPLIVWSERFQPLGRWDSVYLSAEAETSILTVYLRSAPSLPKRQQTVFWRNAQLRPIGRYKRSVNVIGSGDTYINLEPEQPQPGETMTAIVSSNRRHEYVDLQIKRPDNVPLDAFLRSMEEEEDRFTWRFEFVPTIDGLYDIRFVGDEGARVLAVRLLRVARELQIVPSETARLDYHRVYVLLPPTADLKWLEAAARGSFAKRYTLGFSADDAGIGELGNRHVLAVNPHHWPQVLTAAWFQQHYPGARFTAVVANTPEDLSDWLENWEDAP
jgi:hypothetical protein